MLERAGSPDWAMDLYREALESGREPARSAEDGWEGFVRTAVKSGRTGEAEQSLRRRLTTAPSAAAYVARGLLYHNLDRPAEALEALAAAAAADPRSRRALLLGAEVQETSGNVDAAEGLAQSALSIAPDDPEAGGFLASAALARGRLDEALARAEAVLARSPGAPRALEVAAIARAQKGDRDGARRAFESLVTREPDGWSHLNNYAVFELEGGDARAAARLFHQAVSINPGSVDAYRGLSAAGRALGDAAMASRAETALERLAKNVQKTETP
jgi:tetratricopeptide (TPR) repeat protein